MDVVPPKATSSIQSSSTYAPTSSSFKGAEIVFLLVLILVFSWYLVRPKYLEYTDKKTQLDDVKAQLAGLSANEATIMELYNTLQKPELKDELALLDEAVPVRARGTRLYILMEDLVANSGLTLGGLSIDPTTSIASKGYTGVESSRFDGENMLEAYNISLSLTGNMSQFLSFLQTLERNPKLFDVTSLDLGGTLNNTSSYKLVIKTYTIN